MVSAAATRQQLREQGLRCVLEHSAKDPGSGLPCEFVSYILYAYELTACWRERLFNSTFTVSIR
jgi:hypothetical protein